MSDGAIDPSGASWRSAWPDRLIEYGRNLRLRTEGEERERFWLLVNTVLLQFVRSQTHRMGPVDPEDVRDIAAEKSLDLLRQFDSGQWNPGGSTRSEVIRFVSNVARNGLVDHWRRSRRTSAVRPESLESLDRPRPGSESPAIGVERERFAQALVGCAGALKPKHRLVWFFRIFYEMSSRTIANHPEVELKEGHVDVILQRCRDQIRACMRARGFDPTDMPPGTFSLLWEAMRLRCAGGEEAGDGS